MRAKDANPTDGTKVIQYGHHNWECITWQFIRMEDGSYLLHNLFTLKAIQPSSAPKECVDLCQQPIGGTPLQCWEFIEQSEGEFLIRLKGTSLFATASTDEENAPIVLMPKQATPRQVWRKVRQSPWI